MYRQLRVNSLEIRPSLRCSAYVNNLTSLLGSDLQTPRTRSSGLDFQSATFDFPEPESSTIQLNRRVETKHASPLPYLGRSWALLQNLPEAFRGLGPNPQRQSFTYFQVLKLSFTIFEYQSKIRDILFF